MKTDVSHCNRNKIFILSHSLFVTYRMLLEFPPPQHDGQITVHHFLSVSSHSVKSCQNIVVVIGTPTTSTLVETWVSWTCKSISIILWPAKSPKSIPELFTMAQMPQCLLNLRKSVCWQHSFFSKLSVLVLGGFPCTPTSGLTTQQVKATTPLRCLVTRYSASSGCRWDMACGCIAKGKVIHAHAIKTHWCVEA